MNGRNDKQGCQFILLPLGKIILFKPQHKGIKERSERYDLWCDKKKRREIRRERKWKWNGREREVWLELEIKER